ncbi:aspartyl-phosphate phosphatase Spo0E family protein [Cohnella terricola]|nr:aspartyl-phosphate phosphatase Spo0E family protein [Cohnella terricola]
MAAAEHKSTSMSSLQADTPIISHYPRRAAELAEEIDDLRKAMTDTFLKEHSLVADSVIQLSRQLDMKINEYMKYIRLCRE